MAVKSAALVPVPATAEDLGEPNCSQQCRDRWCWAACIQMALPPGNPQCAIVNRAFPDFTNDEIDCCDDFFGNCDRGCPRDLVPAAFGNNQVAAAEADLRTVDLEWLRRTLRSGQKVAAEWGSEVSNHMVVVLRASGVQDLLVVGDPDRFGCSKMTFAQLGAPDGRWTGWKLQTVWLIG